MTDMREENAMYWMLQFVVTTYGTCLALFGYYKFRKWRKQKAIDEAAVTEATVAEVKK